MSRFSLQISTIIMYHYRNNNGLLRVRIMFRLASGRVIMALNYVHVGLRRDALCLLKVMLLHFTLAWWAASSTSLPFSEPCLSLRTEGFSDLCDGREPSWRFSILSVASCAVIGLLSPGVLLVGDAVNSAHMSRRKLRTNKRTIVVLSSDLLDRVSIHKHPLSTVTYFILYRVSFVFY